MPLLPAALTPWMTYIKVGAFLAILAVAGYGAWHVRGILADGEVAEAKEAVRADMQQQIDDERALRGVYQALADDNLAKLLKSISTLRGEFKEIKTALDQDMRDNPQAYKAPLPDKGYEAWKKARSTVQSSTAAPSP